MGIVNRHKETQVDPILTRMVEEDKVAWYKKPNLRHLYFMLFPTCMGVELTSGFDSQLINALQIVPTWVDCMFTRNSSQTWNWQLCHAKVVSETICLRS